MSSTSGPEARDRTSLRWALLLLALPLVGLWVLFSVALWEIRCGDNCSSQAEAQRWEYTGQLVLAMAGAGSVLAVLVAGVLGAGLTARRLALVAGPCTVGWLLWVLVFGTF